MCRYTLQGGEGMNLTVGSCFAGIGGIDLGLEASGHFSTAWWSEVEPGACRVMAARFPDAEPLGDILAIVGGLFPPPPVDVIAGGPPCQDVSKGNAWGRMRLRENSRRKRIVPGRRKRLADLLRSRGL